VLVVGAGVVNSHRADQASKVIIVDLPVPISGSVLPPAATTLGCIAGSAVVADGIATLQVAAATETIISWHCLDTHGRHPSLTRVFRGIPGVSSHPAATLLMPSQKLAVLNFRVVRRTVEITAVAASADSGADWNWSGRAVLLSFTTTDGQSYAAGAFEWLGQPCAQADLSVVVWAPSWWVGEQTALLRFINQGARTCVVSGYPTVTALDHNGAHRVPATLNGPFGGVVSSPEPPIVLLAPKQVATALLEARTANGRCGRSDRLAVSLAGFAVPVTVPYRIDLCGLQVHPLTDQYLGPTS
jgi:hypothetical protein